MCQCKLTLLSGRTSSKSSQENLLDFHHGKDMGLVWSQLKGCFCSCSGESSSSRKKENRKKHILKLERIDNTSPSWVPVQRAPALPVSEVVDQGNWLSQEEEYNPWVPLRHRHNSDGDPDEDFEEIELPQLRLDRLEGGVTFSC